MGITEIKNNHRHHKLAECRLGERKQERMKAEGRVVSGKSREKRNRKKVCRKMSHRTSITS